MNQDLIIGDMISKFQKSSQGGNIQIWPEDQESIRNYLSNLPIIILNRNRN